MKQQEMRLSRPLYESLPWLYIALGIFSLVVSYAQESTLLSFVLGLPGLIALVGGIVLLLRRRDYRQMREQYQQPDALSESVGDIEKQ